ncbi:MAG: DUF721 domain-containing protein [Acidobacteriota bacterium]
MQRAGNVLRKLGLPGASIPAEELARAAWPAAAGKRIAARARAVSFQDGCLVIEVDDSVWLQHLRTMSRHILARVQEIAGKDAVRKLEFRPGVPRREPRRAEGTRAQADEADKIQDPILRMVYRSSRARSA